MTVPTTWTILTACRCGTTLRIDTTCRQTALEVRRVFWQHHSGAEHGEPIRPLNKPERPVWMPPPLPQTEVGR